jgi:hypothetical protein
MHNPTPKSLRDQLRIAWYRRVAWLTVATVSLIISIQLAWRVSEIKIEDGPAHNVEVYFDR